MNGLWTPQSAAIGLTDPPIPQPAALWPSPRNDLRQRLTISSRPVLPDTNCYSFTCHDMFCSDSMPGRNGRALDCETWQYCSRSRDLIRGQRPTNLPVRVSSVQELRSRRVHQVIGHLQTSWPVHPARPDPDFNKPYHRPIYSVTLRVNVATCKAAN